jgi:serine/threonine protein kinase
MGVVHKAEDAKLGRLVTLEFLPDKLSRDKHALERFQREACAAPAFKRQALCARSRGSGRLVLLVSEAV